MKFFLLLSFIILGCQTKHAETTPRTSGKVIKIVDGDTYDILLDNNTTKRIRMDAIDAPERGMPFYKVSKDYLGTLCFGQTVRLEQTAIDQYGRTVAKTYRANGDELGLLMIEAGYAWHFKKYSSDKMLAKAEASARNRKAGLWIDDLPAAPWEWRASKKKGYRRSAVSYRQ
jgi:micrococcal nuclease